MRATAELLNRAVGVRIIYSLIDSTNEIAKKNEWREYNLCANKAFSVKYSCIDYGPNPKANKISARVVRRWWEGRR